MTPNTVDVQIQLPPFFHTTKNTNLTLFENLPPQITNTFTHDGRQYPGT